MAVYDDNTRPGERARPASDARTGASWAMVILLAVIAAGLAWFFSTSYSGAPRGPTTIEENTRSIPSNRPVTPAPTETAPATPSSPR